MKPEDRFMLHNEETLRRRRIEQILRSMPPAMRERTLERLHIEAGRAMGVEFRLNEREHDEGIRLHPAERARAHREAAKR